MKKTKISKKTEAKKGEVCVPSRFPDSSALKTMKTGVRAGGGDPPDGGSCPGKSRVMSRVS